MLSDFSDKFIQFNFKVEYTPIRLVFKLVRLGHEDLVDILKRYRDVQTGIEGLGERELQLLFYILERLFKAEVNVGVHA